MADRAAKERIAAFRAQRTQMADAKAEAEAQDAAIQSELDPPVTAASGDTEQKVLNDAEKKKKKTGKTERAKANGGRSIAGKAAVKPAGNPVPVDEPLPPPVIIDSDEDDSMDLDSLEPHNPANPVIPSTSYAGPYKSRFLDLNPALRPLLQHVNCSYLSTRGKAPSLCDLKSHAQALTNLIKHLTVSTSSTQIDIGAYSNQNQAFDFLLDLTKRYANLSVPHTLALTSVMNTVENTGNAIPAGYRPRCPLYSAPDMTDEDHSLPMPYATQQALISHADDVLERLDHEFGAEGGILGMLPMDEFGLATSVPNTMGRQSVLGQWIAYTRSLAGRVHELEKNLKETLDIVGGEAIIPRERLSRAPLRAQHDGFAGLQDKFLLALEEETWPKFCTEFAIRENDSKGDIVTLEVVTKYSRLRGGRTIFISPSVIAPARKEPGVVQVVKAEWRDRSSVWEQRYGAELARARALAPEAEAARHEAEMLQEVVEGMWAERAQWKIKHGETEQVVFSLGDGENVLKGKDLKDLGRRENELARRMQTFGEEVRQQMRLLQEKTEAAERYWAGGGVKGVEKPVWV